MTPGRPRLLRVAIPRAAPNPSRTTPPLPATTSRFPRQLRMVGGRKSVYALFGRAGWARLREGWNSVCAHRVTAGTALRLAIGRPDRTSTESAGRFWSGRYGGRLPGWLWSAVPWAAATRNPTLADRLARTVSPRAQHPSAASWRRRNSASGLPFHLEWRSGGAATVRLRSESATPPVEPIGVRRYFLPATCFAAAACCFF